MGFMEGQEDGCSVSSCSFLPLEVLLHLAAKVSVASRCGVCPSKAVPAQESQRGIVTGARNKPLSCTLKAVGLILRTIVEDSSSLRPFPSFHLS